MDLRNKLYIMHYFATQGYGQGVGFAVSLFSLTSVGTYFLAKFIPAITNYTLELIIITVFTAYMLSVAVGYIFYNKGYRQRQHLAEMGANPTNSYPYSEKEILGYDASILGHDASLLGYQSTIINLENSIRINEKLGIPIDTLKININEQKTMMEKVRVMRDKLAEMRSRAKTNVEITDVI